MRVVPGSLGLTLLLAGLSVVSAQQPKPPSAPPQTQSSYVYDDEMDDPPPPDTTPAYRPKPDLKSKSSPRKFTIQNIFKVSPPNDDKPNPPPPLKPDLNLKTFFDAAAKARAEDARFHQLTNPPGQEGAPTAKTSPDMEGVSREAQREARRLVAEVLSRAETLYDSLGASFNQEAGSNRISDGALAGGGREDYDGDLEDPNSAPGANGGSWNDEMGVGLAQATAAIASLRTVDERILRMLQADDKCH